MSLDCILTVEGKTRPVKDFLHNNDRYYGAVKRHLNECGVCSSREALEGFLQSREGTYGLTSATLCKMAVTYYRAFPGKIPEALVNEFFIRGMRNWEHFASRIKFLTEDDVIRAHALIIEARKKLIKGILPKLEKGIKKKNQNEVTRLVNHFDLYPFHSLKRKVNDYRFGSDRRKPHWRTQPWMEDDPRFKLAVSLINGSSDDIDKDEEDPNVIRFHNLKKVWFVMNM